MDNFWPDLIALPILLPLLMGASLLLMGEGRRTIKAAINIFACLLNLVFCAALVVHQASHSGYQSIGVYLPGNWPAPYGIVLVVDGLSALMLLITAILATAASVYASASWHRAGVHFHAIFQMQIMGLNGSFLTGDLFNLFVFFEIMLTASYGLLLHGSGWARVRSGLHMIAINLTAATLFLIGAALLYGITGTLNLADMAVVSRTISPADRGLLQAGAAILGVAFLAKAGAWPLAFWLPGAYSNAAAPVSALFAVMTKLGVYALLRIWTLLFNANGLSSSSFGAVVITSIGFVTLIFGALGMFSTRHLARLIAYGVIVSSGTLLSAIGLGSVAVTGAALYYASGSTLALGAMFLLIELIDRARQTGQAPELVRESLQSAPGKVGGKGLTFQSFSAQDQDGDRAQLPLPGVNLDDSGVAITGYVIPAAMAFLGITFMACALTVAGLPPMPGFIGKLSMLWALLAPASVKTMGWVFMVLLLVASLLSIIGVSRVFVRYLWVPRLVVPHLRLAETLPIAFLVGSLALLSIGAGPALKYTTAAAKALFKPSDYISAVFGTRAAASPKIDIPSEQ